MPHTKSPHKKCFRTPETKMKLQSYGDTLVLTEAKIAISLKQWGMEEEEGRMFYDLFICFQ